MEFVKVSKNCQKTIFWVPRNVFLGSSGNSNRRMKSIF